MGLKAITFQMFGCQVSPQKPNICLKNSIIIKKYHRHHRLLTTTMRNESGGT